MSLKKPSETEEEYFARINAEKQRKLAHDKGKSMVTEEREQLKRLHFMHCPKCGMELQAVSFRGIQIDKCYYCNGTWLDEGELEHLAGKEPGFLQSIIGVFKGD
ncbi:MAG: zf-TFIIB domain-containing protein [Deltaproteobacteria bacterium]|nr:zf-TFIIB domain-containing protein [Deltaproteobacteria bacterium]